MKGTIFSIEEFSVYDGPGIRTSVFFKGCPLSCTWCHNPEGQKPVREIVRNQNGCLRCGCCEREATRKDGELLYTEKSIQACPAHLLRYMGEVVESDELCERVLKNASMLVGGGVTFSGGEPMFQSDFLLSCLSYMKGKLHTAVQTSGFASSEEFGRVMALADYFLYDLKIMDNDLHREYTGVDNRPILENFRTLANGDVPFVVRVPLIPRITDTEENVEAIARFLDECDVRYAELLPYNKMAGGKYKLVGREYQPRFDETVEVTPHGEIFAAYSIQTEIL